MKAIEAVSKLSVLKSNEIFAAGKICSACQAHRDSAADIVCISRIPQITDIFPIRYIQLDPKVSLNRGCIQIP